MKVDTLSTFFLTALGASAQLVSTVAPAPNIHIPAGQPFTATVAIEPTTSSVNVIALFCGAKADDPNETDLGQTDLTIILAPQSRGTGPIGQMVQNIELTFPNVDQRFGPYV